MKTKLLLFLMLGFYNVSIGQCWTQITAGGRHTLAVKEDGTLWTWGGNSVGQLGDGTLIERHTPVQIGTDNNWKMVSAGYFHSMAIKTNGTLWGWGDNTYYQLGDGTTVRKTLPVQIGTDTNWQFVDAGFTHTIALKTNGTLWVCGMNSENILGNGGTIQEQKFMGQLGTDTDWQSVSTSRWHTQAIKTNGTLWAWGRGYPGLLGNGTINNSSVPIQIGNQTDWKHVTANDYLNAAIKLNGTLWTWGDNTWGQLGLGSNTLPASYVPVQVGTESNWKSLSSMDVGIMAIKNDGTLWSWGSNEFGQLALGFVSNNVPTPTQVGVNTNWSKLSKGRAAHSFMISSNGTLWASGSNEYGQLGDGTTINRSSPIPKNCTSLGNIDFLQKNKLNVYPNPSQDFVVIDFANGNVEQFQYQFIDITGRVIVNGKGMVGEKIYIDKFNSGSYLLKVEIAGEVYSIRILKN